ncbi:hypothetical protein LNKW23_07140 [Paralimibaculum aggregatum]|uniref:Uncharacterized protein n=1 Tax=Paralimibaculum aggregatum TaxID=3036245 RepID=A0ABQ6LM43_9RHOB|nr:hypothetical protein LNKW23_07140 [Limibaculum sp. NKW23]
MQAAPAGRAPQPLPGTETRARTPAGVAGGGTLPARSGSGDTNRTKRHYNSRMRHLLLCNSRLPGKPFILKRDLRSRRSCNAPRSAPNCRRRRPPHGPGGAAIAMPAAGVPADADKPPGNRRFVVNALQ